MERMERITEILKELNESVYPILDATTIIVNLEYELAELKKENLNLTKQINLLSWRE